jgi:arylsulfatase A-like enzyme
VSERNNVLVVVLDSVRAKNTSLHGYSRETTPFLSTFADRSTVYTQARAPGIHSIASHVSMFTGAHVEEHGATHHTTAIDPTRTVWHDLEREHGYATGLFTNNRIVSNASNLADCFGHVHEPNYPLTDRLENRIDGTVLKRAYFRGYDGLARLTAALGSDDDGTRADASGDGGVLDGLSAGIAGGVGRVADIAGLSGASTGYKTLFGGEFVGAFLDWEARQDGPWAACLNLMDAHSPYEPQSEYDRWADERNWRIQSEAKPSVWESLDGEGWDRLAALEPLYDGAIRQTDAVVRKLVAGLEQRGLLSDTLLVVTSDHGEAFGEQSRLLPAVRLRDHKWGVHEALTHVPLVVSYPGQSEHRVVDEVVSLTDTPALVRTAVTDDADGDPLTGSEVLTSTFRLPEQKTSKYGSIDDIDRYVGPWRAVYETREDSVRKFARKGERGLTLDIDGPRETTVVDHDDGGRVAEAYDRLADTDLVTQQTTDIDDDLEEQLEDLGYIR